MIAVTATHRSNETTIAQSQKLFCELIDLANNKNSTFEAINARFVQLLNSCPNRFNYDYIIADDKKGERFSKVLEIKAQLAHLFVAPIAKCTLDKVCQDGFTRKIIINVPGHPEFEERLFIKKNANGEMDVIFVENDNKDQFACLNRVYQDGGKWHWSGSYLYGELDGTIEEEREKKQMMFDDTSAAMLAFLDNPAFESTYQQLVRL